MLPSCVCFLSFPKYHENNGKGIKGGINLQGQKQKTMKKTGDQRGCEELIHIMEERTQMEEKELTLPNGVVAKCHPRRVAM